MEEMKEFSFPFDAIEDEQGEFDREYSAKDFATYFKQFISNGVYPNPSNGLEVEALTSNMVVTLHSGSGFINGYAYVLPEDLPIFISPSHASYNRKDSIVLQWNATTRAMKAIYKEGVASANPQVPALVRNADIYELQLAIVLVKSGTQRITQAEITPKKLDSTVCGIVHCVVDHVDTTEIFKQYETYLNQKIAEWNATKAQQKADWENQMSTQQEGWQTQTSTQQKDFDARQAVIQAWFDKVQGDISKLQTFDINNLFSFVGCTMQERKVDGKYINTLKYTLTGTKVAEMVDEKVGEDYVCTLSIYTKDGLNIEKKIQKIDKKVTEGYDTIISEVI